MAITVIQEVAAVTAVAVEAVAVVAEVVAEVVAAVNPFQTRYSGLGT